MRLLKNLHEAGIFLSVDQIYVGVHVVVFEGFKAVAFFLIVGALFFALFLIEVSFGVERVSLDLHGPLLVEFNKLLFDASDSILYSFEINPLENSLNRRVYFTRTRKTTCIIGEKQKK